MKPQIPQIIAQNQNPTPNTTNTGWMSWGVGLVASPFKLAYNSIPSFTDTENNVPLQNRQVVQDFETTLSDGIKLLNTADSLKHCGSIYTTTAKKIREIEMLATETGMTEEMSASLKQSFEELRILLKTTVSLIEKNTNDPCLLTLSINILIIALNTGMYWNSDSLIDVSEAFPNGRKEVNDSISTILKHHHTAYLANSQLPGVQQDEAMEEAIIEFIISNAKDKNQRPFRKAELIELLLTILKTSHHYSSFGSLHVKLIGLAFCMDTTLSTNEDKSVKLSTKAMQFFSELFLGIITILILLNVSRIAI